MFWRWKWKRLRREGLFRFWDGQTVRVIDGLRLASQLMRRREFTDPAFQSRLEQQDPEAEQAFLDSLAEVLGVQRFDSATGRGITDLELIAVGQELARWITEKKTLGLPLPTPSPISEPSFSGSSLRGETPSLD